MGGDYFDNRRKESKIDYHLRQLQKLGYSTQIEPLFGTRIKNKCKACKICVVFVKILNYLAQT